MTTQLLAIELANLIQESKRKHNDLRQAAENSLDELRHIGNVSEDAALELFSQKPSFVNPFIIACGTKNAKFTGIAIVCLQRLIIVRALPRLKLSQVLEALVQASSAGPDVQLKILQALPSLLQNYSSDLNGDLLVTALNICFILQSSKNAIVINTSAATLQQLVVSVFDKVVVEDKHEINAPFAGDAPTTDSNVAVRSAALDAYRIFNDICLLTENQRPEFLHSSGLPQTFGLELIESVITNHAAVFTTHPEQAQVLRSRVMPLLINVLKGNPTFATTVRLVRILYTLLRRHMSILPSECGEALSILMYILDQDTTIWKRALCMEVFRGIFSEHPLVRRIFALYDSNKCEKDILKTLTAIFVRMSTEQPGIIGLSHQSTMPATDATGPFTISTDQGLLESSSATGIIGGSIASEMSNTGISIQWSTVRVPCIDQLDKTEAPAIPESYIYSLILTCLSSLSDGVAKFILPLTVPSDRVRRKAPKEVDGHGSPAPLDLEADGSIHGGSRERTIFKKHPAPHNPLDQKSHPAYPEVKICSEIIDECWPAILATCSTFLLASLDSEYYHGLVRAFQRFTHVAGLLRLSTPRDAFLTTLGKAAVPPNVLSTCVNACQSRPKAALTPTETSGNLLRNSRGLLSVENLTLGSHFTEKRQASVDTSATLTTRNLLCLRALLNLGIALGPTLGPAWGIIVETLQQADFVFFATGKAPGRIPCLSRGGQDQLGETEVSLLMANFSTELQSVETAASRLIESSIDLPNEAFVELVDAICGLLSNRHGHNFEARAYSQSPNPAQSARSSSGQHRRTSRFPSRISATPKQELQFALAKIGEIGAINLERLVTHDPEDSGWTLLTKELIKILGSPAMSPPVRIRATEILAKLMLKAASEAISLPDKVRGPIQLRLLGALHDALIPLQRSGRDISITNTATDINIHKIVLEGLRGIIEDCGQKLVSGWDVAFDIIGSVFITRESSLKGHRSDPNARDLTTRSPKLVRSSFSSFQLICSDFLPSLPDSCFLILVDTLHKFCSQNDDLNIALTTVTFFWALSDFLSEKEMSLNITTDMIQHTGPPGLEHIAADRSREGSGAALWMQLLFKLTAIASDERLELRNSAIHTLLRVFDGYGERLSPEAWSMCINSIVFKLFHSLEEELKATDDNEVDENYRLEWHDTAVVVLNGISTLLGNHLEVLTGHPSFSNIWRELLGHLAALLDFRVLDINTATFKALGHVLSQHSNNAKAMFNKTTVRFVWDLWSQGIPITKAVCGKTQDNQNCLSAYVAAFCEVYRLIESDLTVKRARQILTLLRQTVEGAFGPYATDVEHVTPLQAQILESVRMIRTDVSGVPSAMIMQASEFVTLACSQNHSVQYGPKRTYVAIAKASMQWLESLILSHAADVDIYKSGAVSAALSALCRLIALKYQFPIATKSISLWRLATSSALTVIQAIVSQLNLLDIPKNTTHGVWSLIAAIADSILSADCDSAPSGTQFADDETADIAAFRQLVKSIIPSIGSDNVADTTRKAYAESLFKTSMIHEPTLADKAIIFEGCVDGLLKLYTPRSGRTVTVPPTQRTQMAYVAFEELFSLISVDQQSLTKSPTTKHSEPIPILRTRIACATAPFLIVRCALTLRAYVADQPLRGRMLQPLSQRKEFLWTLRKLVDMKSQTEAIPALKGSDSECRKHLLRLYPLIVNALGVQCDEKMLRLLKEALAVVGDELGVV